MKRIGTTAILLIVCIALLSSCSAFFNGGEKERIPTIEEGVLAVGMETGYAPMAYYDRDRKLVGFDVELAAALAEEMNLELKLVDKIWDEIFFDLNENKYDIVISAVSRTDDREEAYALSSPYLNNTTIIIAPVEKGINDISHLERKNVGVQMSSAQDETMGRFVADRLDINLIQYERIDSVFKALKEGEVDAVCIDSIVMAYYLGEDASQYKTIWESEEKEPCCIVFNKDKPQLKEKVEEALASLRSKGVLSDLAVKYFKMATILG